MQPLQNQQTRVETEEALSVSKHHHWLMSRIVYTHNLENALNDSFHNRNFIDLK